MGDLVGISLRLAIRKEKIGIAGTVLTHDHGLMGATDRR